MGGEANSIVYSLHTVGQGSVKASCQSHLTSTQQRPPNLLGRVLLSQG